MAEASHKERYPWTSREIDILIALWDNEDVLYNTRCVDYFKRDKRVEALDRLSDTLKIPISEIRKKMTNLRTYYGKELWKEKKTLKTEDETDSSKVYQSRWQFFKPLNFLRENCNPRHSKNDLNDSCDVVFDEDDNDDCADTWNVESNLLSQVASLSSVNGAKEDKNEEIVEEISNNQIENTFNDSPTRTVASSKKIVEKRKKTGEDIESVIAKLRRTSTVNKPQQNSCEELSFLEVKPSNPDMIFAQHVGLTLMNMKNAKTKDLAKLKIQQALFDTQYGEESVQIQAFPISSLQVNQ